MCVCERERERVCLWFYVSTYMYACVCFYPCAFCHLLSCVNREHRKVWGKVDESPCWLSPPLSCLSNQEVWEWGCMLKWGWYLSLSLSPLSLSLISWVSRKGGRKEKCSTAASHLWRLARFSLLVAFELHSSEAWQWLPPRRQFKHINVKEFADSVPLYCVYTICTHKNIGSVGCCSAW